MRFPVTTRSAVREMLLMRSGASESGMSKSSLKKIAILAGTTEGRELADVAARAGIPCVVYVATPEGEAALLASEDIRTAAGKRLWICVGRLTAEEMAERFCAEGMAAVFDATHPYATEVTENSRRAAKKADAPYYRVLRDNSEIEEFSPAHEVADAAEAAKLLQTEYVGKRVLLTTGSKELSAFSGVDPACLFARLLPGEENEQRALCAGLKKEHLLFGRGPFTGEENSAVFEKHRIEVLVTKDSGAAGGYPEKLAAAEKCQVSVITIRRPKEEDGITLAEAVKLLEHMDPVKPVHKRPETGVSPQRIK